MTLRTASFVDMPKESLVGFVHWGLGGLLAVGLHVVALGVALSSGAGLSLAPEGGGGKGGMTVVMGSQGQGADQVNEIAAASSALPQEVSVPPIEKIKPVPKPAAKPVPKPIPKVRAKPKPVKKHKPQMKAKVRDIAPKIASQKNSNVATSGTHGVVGATGKVNRQAGGAPIGQSIGAGSSKGFGIDTALKAYRRKLHALLMHAKRYPRSAQRLGQEGIVAVSFVVSPDGHASHVKLVTPSAYPALNREGKNLIKRIKNFPPLPPAVSSTAMTFTVRVPFHLR